MKKVLFALCILTVSLGGKPALAEGALSEENFSNTLTLTTDYIFRGTSFSNENPAIQGSFDWANDLNAGGYLFAGVWGTSLNGFDVELDFYAGYGNSVGGIDFWIQPIFYYFPENSGYNIFEIWANASHTFEGAAAPTLNLLYAYSPRWGNGTDNTTAHYLKPSVSFSLPNDFGVDFGAGYQYIEETGAPGSENFNYLHWELGVSKSILSFDLDLRYHDTDEDSSPIYSSRVVFSAARSF